MQRVRRVNPDPNPLFMMWLNQFRNEAAEKENLNLVKLYDTCIDSLGRYPLTLESGQHCLLLSGFGKTICNRLDKKLEEYLKEQKKEPNFPLSPLRPGNNAGGPGYSLSYQSDNCFQKEAESSNKENFNNEKNERTGFSFVSQHLIDARKENEIENSNDVKENHTAVIRKEAENWKFNEKENYNFIEQNHELTGFESKRGPKRKNFINSEADEIHPDEQWVSIEDDKDEIMNEFNVEDDVSEFHPGYIGMQLKRSGRSSVEPDKRDQRSTSFSPSKVKKRKHEDEATDIESLRKKVDGSLTGDIGIIREDTVTSREDQEDEDYQLALRLSQEEIRSHNESMISVKSQEDEDMRLARELQQAFDNEARSLRRDLGISSPNRSLQSPRGSPDELPSPENFQNRITDTSPKSPTNFTSPRQFEEILTESPGPTWRTCTSPSNRPPMSRSPISRPLISKSPILRSPTSRSPTTRFPEDSGSSRSSRFEDDPYRLNCSQETSRSVRSRDKESSESPDPSPPMSTEERVPGICANFSLDSPSINLTSTSNIDFSASHDAVEQNLRNDASGDVEDEENYPAMARFSRLIAESGINGRFKDSDGRGRGRGRGGRGRGRGKTSSTSSSQNNGAIDDSIASSQDTSNRQEKTGGRKKEYVPKTRSGAYAILLTLFKASQRDDYVGYMKKDELQKEAQPLSDQSFSVKNAHSEYYTAWSSVSTLVKRELVRRWSNPAKFDITDKGAQLAIRILNVENPGGQIQVDRRAPARTGYNDSRPPQPQQSSSKNKSSIREEEEVDPGFNLDDVSFSESFSVSTQKSFNRDGAPSTAGSSAGTSSGSSSALSPGISSSASGEPNTNGFRSLLQAPEDGLHPLLKIQRGYLAASSVSTSDVRSRHVPEFVLQAGQFEVLLCVDNTETTGGGAGGRKTLKTETVRHLESCGVAYNRRNLNVGDFLWIARERTRVVPGQFEQQAPRELVLPYIVERKRLDDLWASVKDGRYEEQKFRMKSSGLHRLYYLIEDHTKQRQYWSKAQGGAGGRPVTTESINQAISNTAVQEGFSIIKTKDQKGSVEFLTLFTRILQKKYSKLTLSSCTQADLSNGLVRDRDTCLLTFSELNSASRKNRKMTLKEIFAKMLLKMKGLSVEMAQAIVDEYPTPKSFRDALLECNSESARIKLIQDLSVGLQSKRKIPKSLAEALVNFWTKDDLSAI